MVTLVLESALIVNVKNFSKTNLACPLGSSLVNRLENDPIELLILDLN